MNYFEFPVDEVQTRWRSLRDQYVKIFKVNSNNGEDINPAIIDNAKNHTKFLMIECAFLNPVYKKKIQAEQSSNNDVMISLHPELHDSLNNHQECVVKQENLTQDETSGDIFYDNFLFDEDGQMNDEERTSALDSIENFSMGMQSLNYVTTIANHPVVKRVAGNVINASCVLK